MGPLAYTLAALSTELSGEGNFFQDKQLNYLVNNNFLSEKKKKKNSPNVNIKTKNLQTTTKP